MKKDNLCNAHEIWGGYINVKVYFRKINNTIDKKEYFIMIESV